MISLLKTFGKGLLYVIGAPFFIVALVIFGAIGLLAFIFQIIKSIIYFFTGQKFFPELPEDKKLRLMREAANQQNEQINQENNESIISPIYQEVEKEPEPIFIQRAPVAPTIEQAAFEDTSSLEDMVEDDPLPEPEPEEEVQEEIEEENHTVLETAEEEKEEVEDDYEELETYIPKSSTYSDADDDDENDTSTGVKIDYDL